MLERGPSVGKAYALTGLGRVALQDGKPALARELFGEAGYFGHGPIMHEKVFEVPFVEGRLR